MRITSCLLAIALTLGLAACHSSDPKTLVKEGQTALNSGRSDEALAKFEEAAKALKHDDPLYFEARLGMASAHIEKDPKKTVEEFLALAKELPDKVTEKEFVLVSGQMVSARKYSEAVDLVHAGIVRSGGKPPALMARIDRIQKEAASDNDVMNKLKGLGYAQ